MIVFTDNPDRREFIRKCLKAGVGASFLPLLPIFEADASEGWSKDEHDPNQVKYGMGISVKSCIGCGNCVKACKTENNVPREPFYFRTWVERYTLLVDAETVVESPNGGADGFPTPISEGEILRSFFIPKLCNHCKRPPCVQVCPVGATYSTPEGVVLVDTDYCVGCRYCIQACPYGARFLNPTTHSADKCTFCYHRLAKGLLPACVEVCPTQARIFGSTTQRASRLTRFFRFNEIQVLKPDLNTEPQVFYARLDGVVR